jgi:hypothetical protein
MASMAQATPKTISSTKPISLNPRTPLSPIIHQCKKPLMEQKISYPNRPTFPIRPQKPNHPRKLRGISRTISTILHNLHKFRTILLNRQQTALDESKLVQTQKLVLPHC